MLRNPDRERAGALHRPGRHARSRQRLRRGDRRRRAGGPRRGGLCGSEGLSALVLDCRAFGGQAGASARIENYLGFPTGITGMALMARAYNQAQKFGAEMAIPDEVATAGDGADAARPFRSDAGRAASRSAPAPSSSPAARAIAASTSTISHAFEGAVGALLGLADRGAGCAPAQEVALVGAGNSAGQAVVYLAEPGRQGLDAGARRRASRPPCRAIWSTASPAQPNIEVLTDTEISGARRARTACSRRSAGATADRRRDAARDPPSVPVHRRRPQHRLAGRLRRRARRQGLRPHRRRAGAARWRPAGPASSPSATCAPARSSASPPRWARARRSSPPSTPFWPRPAAAPVADAEIRRTDGR